MAYPMVPWPAFGEFRQRLEYDFGCRYVTDEEVSVNGAPIALLERDIDDGSTRRYVVTYSEDYRLAPSVVRSICSHLHVDSAVFGFTIG